MTAEKEYLIHLLSCFLNGKTPENRIVDWKEIYRLAEINDICGIIGNEIKLLDNEYKPEGNIKSAFNQQLGFAVRGYEIRTNVVSKIRDLFSELCCEYLFVKGAAINKYYPIKELRTSGDIDILVRNKDFDTLLSVFERKCSSGQNELSGFMHKDDTIMFYLSDVLIEVHNGADLQNDYFSDIFEVANKINNYEYELSLYDNLIYVFLHLVKHIADRGAGIRMLMDLDVLIRNINDFSEEKFYSDCTKADELNYAQILLSVLSKAFKTPVNDTIAIYDNPELYDGIIDVMLDGGSFGYLVQSTGFYHYYVNNDNTQGVSAAAKFKAIVRYVFPPLNYVRGYREYSVKHPVLTPIAYLARAKDAIFKRRKKAIDTFSQIMKVKDEDLSQRKFLEKIDTDNGKRRD